MPQDMTFVDELIEAIKDAVAAGEGGGTEPELNALANQIVTALSERDGRTIRETFEKVQACFGEIVTRDGAGPTVFDERSLTDELRSYVRMLAVAVQRIHPDEIRMDDLNLTRTDLAILRALADKSPLSGLEIVGQIDAAKETVSRRLPLLRLHGLVESMRRGKATMNKITPAGTTALADREIRPVHGGHRRLNVEIAISPLRAGSR